MRARGYLAVLAAVTLWGCTYLLLDVLLKRHFPPSELIAIRYSSSLILTLVVFGRSISKYNVKVENQTTSMQIAVGAGFALALAAFTQNYGIQITGDPVYSAFLSALIAVLIPLLQKLTGDSLSLKKVMAPIGLALIGTALLIRFQIPTLGDVLLLGCALFYAAQTVLVGKIKTRIHYAQTHAIACACCIVTALPFLLKDLDRLIGPSTTQEWIGLSALAVLSTFLPWNLIHYAQQVKNLDAYRVGLLYTLEPVITAAVGLPLMSLGAPISVKSMTLTAIIGCLLIVVANERMAKLDAN